MCGAGGPEPVAGPVARAVLYGFFLAFLRQTDFTQSTILGLGQINFTQSTILGLGQIIFTQSTILGLGQTNFT